MKAKSQAQFPHLLLDGGYIKDKVYHTIRNAILDGRLAAGTKLPSSRAFAEMMSISRNSVIAGFDRLTDEGYLFTKKGAGTYVSTTRPDDVIKLPTKMCHVPKSQQTTFHPNSNLTNLATQWEKSRPNTSQYKMFNIGVGCVDQFPHDLWGRILGRAWRSSKREITHYNHPAGYPPLKKVLADYVRSTRGVNCHQDQIIIVNGTQQAINIAAKVLLQTGDRAWLDDPGYDSARAILSVSGINISPIPSDNEGMDIAYAAKYHADAKFIYTAPSHQFPLGTTLSLPRRLALLEWAYQNNAWIFEDDYNSEFRYLSKPIQALQGLDKYQRVIYSGTFSKMMYPGFRLGFLIVPEKLQEAFTMIKYYSDSHSGYLEQAALAQFIQEGHYARHVRRVRKICYSRQLTLIETIRHYLPHVFEVELTDSGIHAVCWVKPEYNLQDIISACRQLGFGIQPLSRYCINSQNNNAILFGYAAHNETDITNNIIALSHIIKYL